MAGPALRRAREMAGLDRADAARRVGVGRRDLRGIESGVRPVSTAVLERAISVYGDDDLDLPPRQDLRHPTHPHLLVIGDEVVHVDPFRDDDSDVLADYVAAVRRQRGLGPDAEIRFRSADLVQLASVLDLAAPDLERRLRRAAKMDDVPARRAARLLVLTGLALALAGATERSARDMAWTPPLSGVPLFDVTARSARTRPIDSRIPAADPVPHGAVPVAPELFTTREQTGAVVRDSSWLARDGRRPAFSTEPRVRLDAAAEVVANVVAAASGELAGPRWAIEPAALPAAPAALAVAPTAAPTA
ncbi:MAG TPA: helix-turn-helix transcriptional regulator [Microthrixaceae bacterium]|nr:helix-turn-helix transcriptional regulator [Microthrixaceae bacterium]